MKENGGEGGHQIYNNIHQNNPIPSLHTKLIGIIFFDTQDIYFSKLFYN